MPARLDRVHEQIREKLLGANMYEPFLADFDDFIKLVTKMTIETMGYAITADGEIYNPAPPPSPTVPPQQNVRWGGGRRRR